MSIATAVIALIFHFWTPQKLLLPFSIFIYSLLVFTTGTLAVQSGGVTSPFIAIWMAVSVFAGLYGMYGLGALIALINLYLIYSFATQAIGRDALVTAVIAGELPMFISYILWNGRESLEAARKHDVSELNQSLEQESIKTDAIVQAIGDGVIAVEQSGAITLINPAAQNMTGWSAKDAIGISYESVLKLQDDKGNAIDPTANPIARVLNLGQQIRLNELCVLTKSGKKIYASFVVSPLGNGEGEGVIAVFRDITKERKEGHAQAEFISTASHEMRTPVAAIEGYLGLALNPATATIDEKAREYINKAHESAQHLGQLFQDLLDVSKADDGRLKANPVVIDVVTFTRDIIEGLEAKAHDKQLELIYTPDGSKTTTGTTVIAPVLYSQVDKDHLREVLDNLIENGIKYTPKGNVTVDITASNDYVRLSVKDSGIGVPAEDLPHLFQKFYRVDNSDTREIGGTGLGLYLCRRLIESMNGRIWVESEHKKGSTFYIEIPRLDHTQAAELLEREAAKRAAEHSEDVTPSATLPPVVSTPTPAPSTEAPAPQVTTPAPAPIETVAPVTPAPQVEPARFGAVAYTPGETPTPAETAAPQLVTPAPAPIATPTPAPTVTIAPQSTQTPRPAQPQRAATSERANIPLAALERNPEQYVSRRPNNPPKNP